MKQVSLLLALTSFILPGDSASAGDPVKILGWRYDDVVVFLSPSGGRDVENHRPKASLPTPISADDYNDRYVRFQDPASGTVLYARKGDAKLASTSNGDRGRTYCGHATAAMGLSKGC